MAEEVKKEESNQNKIPARLLKTPSVYSKSTATPEQITKAKADYVKNVTDAYTKLSKKEISETKYKELIKTCKNDFQMATKGRRYLRMIKLHNRGKTLKSIKLFDFGYFALNKEKVQKLVSLLKDNELLKKKAKAIRNNAIYLSDQIEIDKQKNNLLEVKLQLKYDINQFKSEENSANKIRESKKAAKVKIADIKHNIKQQKKRNKDFYEMIHEKRESLTNEFKNEFAAAKKQYHTELSRAKKLKPKSLTEKIDKKQKIRNIKFVYKEACETYKSKMYVAKNYHPAWVSDPDIKSMFTDIANNRVKRYEVQRDFDNRIDNLKKQFIERLKTENVMSERKRNSIYRFALFKAWWAHAGRKIIDSIIMSLIVVFAILGLFDSIPATSFLLNKAYIGSISVFIFVALIIFSLWVVFKIVELIRRKAGIYDIVEARFSKEDASSSAIGVASKSSADEFAYLEELFNKGAKEAEKTKEELIVDYKTSTHDQIVGTVLKEEGKWAKEEEQTKGKKKTKKS